VPILGVERLVYGVDDLQKCSKFWEDFGLSKIEQSDDGTDVALAIKEADGPTALLRFKSPALLEAAHAVPS